MLWDKVSGGYGAVTSDFTDERHGTRNRHCSRSRLFPGSQCIGISSLVIGTVLILTVLSSSSAYRNTRGTGFDLNSLADDTYQYERISVSIRFQDFMKFKSVTDFLETKGAGEGSSLEDLAKYVPMLIDVKYNRSLMEGKVGAAASNGYIAFAMQYKNTKNSEFSSAYNIVLGSNGSLIAVSPIYQEYQEWNHFNAMKIHGDNMVLGAINVNQSQVGPALLWNWENSKLGTSDSDATGPNAWTYIEVLEEVDSHDIQWAFNNESIWTSSNDCGFTRYDISTGDTEQIYEFPESLVKDPNHIHFIRKDEKVVVSARVQNAILHIDVADSSIDWIAGGDNGTFSIIDTDGVVWPPGTSYWSGQHNVEYFGKNQYMMFDDQSHVSPSGDSQSQIGEKSSRLLIVEILPEKKIARVLWEYYTGYWTPIYGDNDQLPTGNLFSVDWPASVYDDSGEDPGKFPKYDCRIFEVTRSKEIAWQAAITSIPGQKENIDVWEGWSIYSAERFYAAPLLSLATCTATEKNMSIKFVTHSKYKEANSFPGRYTIQTSNSRVLGAGDFFFEPYWLQKSVVHSIDLLDDDSITCLDIVVKVTDRFGSSSLLQTSDDSGARPS